MGFDCGPILNPSGHGLDSSDDGSLPNPNLWIYGVVLALAGCLCSVIGLNLQRYSQTKNALKHADLQKPAYKQPLNIFGVCLMACTALLDFAAFGLAPQSLLAPLGAATLVFNLVVAPMVVKEKPSKLDVASTMLVFAGVILAIIFGDRHSHVFTYDKLYCLFLRKEFMIFAGAIVVLMGAAMVTIGMLECRKGRVARSQALYRVLRTLYPVTAGTFGGSSVLFGKAFAEILKDSFAGKNEFVYKGTYGIIVCMVGSLVMQIRLLNAGLKKYDVLYVVPVYQVFWVLSGILGGAVYFEEVQGFTGLQWAMYSLGVLVALFGVLLLSMRKREDGVLPDGVAVDVTVEDLTEPSDDTENQRRPLIDASDHGRGADGASSTNNSQSGKAVAGNALVAMSKTDSGSMSF